MTGAIRAGQPAWSRGRTTSGQAVGQGAVWIVGRYPGDAVRVPGAGHRRAPATFLTEGHLDDPHPTTHARPGPQNGPERPRGGPTRLPWTGPAPAVIPPRQQPVKAQTSTTTSPPRATAPSSAGNAARKPTPLVSTMSCSPPVRRMPECTPAIPFRDPSAAPPIRSSNYGRKPSPIDWNAPPVPANAA